MRIVVCRSAFLSAINEDNDEFNNSIIY